MNHSLVAMDEALALVDSATIAQETSTSVELLFDSFRQPASEGIRSGAVGLRHILYRADPYQIDLQLEVDHEHNRLIVAGQLLDVSHPAMPCLNVQVMLSNLRGNVLNIATNQFGEFRGDVENSGDLELSFLAHGERRIVILLRGSLEQSPGPPSGT